MDLFWPRLVASHFPSSVSQVPPMRVRLNIQGGGDPMKVAILVVAIAASCLIEASCFALDDTESPKVWHADSLKTLSSAVMYRASIDGRVLFRRVRSAV
jgi:hypothetical protein